MSEDARWKVGPYAIRPVGWPESWFSYADQYYYRSDGEGLTDLEVALVEVGPKATGPQSVNVDQLALSQVSGGRWRIASEDALDAVYDPAASRLELRIFAHLEAPHLVLGNALRGVISVALPLFHKGLMFHASSGILEGQGLFFPGISTAGKTTLALGMEGATYMSDDITLVGALDATPTLLASPFFGIAGRKGANVDAPLAAVGVLVRKNPERTVIERLRPPDAARELMRHAICWSTDRELQAAILSRVLELAERVPVFAVERFLGDSSDEVCARVLEAR